MNYYKHLSDSNYTNTMYDTQFLATIMIMMSSTFVEAVRALITWSFEHGVKLAERLGRKIWPRCSVEIEYIVPKKGECEINPGTNQLLDAIFARLKKNGAVSDNSVVTSFSTDRDTAGVVVKPLDGVKKDGLTFDYSYDFGSKDSNANTRLTITGSRREDIIKFIDDCSSDYIKQLDGDNKLRIFIYIANERSYERPEVISVENKNSTTFDTLFFPERDEIMRLADRVRSGPRRKLSLMLHGVPGCGKTSIIKALANYLSYSIIVIKMSSLHTDNDLLAVMHATTLYAKNEHRPVRVGEKRIIVFEDVDADNDVILSRSDQPKSSSDSDSDSDSDELIRAIKKSKKPASGLTLAGILNILDGIIELDNVIIVFTSNFPEKLDSALMRPGRIDYKIELKRMTAMNANRLVDKYLPGKSLKFADDEVTPAELHELLKDAPDIEWLAERVAAITGRDPATLI